MLGATYIFLLAGVICTVLYCINKIDGKIPMVLAYVVLALMILPR